MPIFVVSLVAPGTTLRSTELFHLSNALLELLVLALLVAMSLVLWGRKEYGISYIYCEINKVPSKRSGCETYLALPGKVVLLLSATVQWNQKVCARVAVLKGKAGIRHFLAGGS